MYAETRPLAEELTYRYLAAAHAWAATEDAAVTRIGPLVSELDRAPDAPGPSTAEVRAWAREHGITVPNRGRLRPEIFDAWQAAHQPRPSGDTHETL
ncbi:histone-like nucleoid-structuring protein Lsr2 [Actinomycetes bacterium KLBMP 9797]